MKTRHEKNAGAQGRSGAAGHRGVSFVATLWLEPTDRPDQPEWRWRVVEVYTGDRHYFRRLADLLAYVSERAGVPPPQ
ncbi:MAG: hypothetical protein HY676_01270 [Chloroflexi bacterium]|nr:hypothetical protein [Chloroflexota bacterium]